MTQPLQTLLDKEVCTWLDWLRRPKYGIWVLTEYLPSVLHHPSWPDLSTCQSWWTPIEKYLGFLLQVCFHLFGLTQICLWRRPDKYWHSKLATFELGQSFHVFFHFPPSLSDTNGFGQMMAKGFLCSSQISTPQFKMRDIKKNKIQ
jgi:hypothetical protein